MAQKQTTGKIAAFVAKYSNSGTGSGYRGAILAFLRCIYDLPETEQQKVGTKVVTLKPDYDYEKFFDMYLADKKRDRVEDMNKFAKFLLEDSVSKQSARQRLTYAVKVLRSHGVDINKDDIGDIKRETKGGAGTTDRVMDHNVICKALNGSTLQMRAIILIACSSGMRIDEILKLKMNYIEMEQDPVIIHVDAKIAKNGKSRFTFISDEAKKALDDYLETRFTPDFFDDVNRRTENLGKGIAPREDDKETLFPVSYTTILKMWGTLLRNSNQWHTDENTGRNQYRIHSFRKFFISQLSMAGIKTLAEHLAGHEGYLDASYRQVSPEFAAREYKKVQSVLTVCIPESIKAGIKMADEKISILMEKTDLQSDGIEGVKSINAQLRAEIVAMRRENDQKIAALQSDVAGLVEFMRKALDSESKDDVIQAHGKLAADNILKQKPGRRGE